MKRMLVLSSVVALLLAGAVTAAVKQGDMEIEAMGGWTSISPEGGGNDISVIHATGGVGYFVTNNIQVMGVGELAIVDTGAADTINVYGIGARGKFHFMPDNPWVPYVGAQLVWVTADFGDSVSGMMWGPLGGVRHELSPTTDLFVEGQWQQYTGDISDALDTGYMVLVGLSHSFN